ncbi:flavin monoamine oxidase family protein [Bacillus sp. DX1.1]|uniref:flavin monoamine oxidase family protein n=1 Tax=unclassified Bacillus (in: firmicutes) TaxID=185979 RepID=UPI002570AE52|nr:MULTISPECIES: flavin monoamine oxidase family protein [unclassified Bacillus (in: firmicutes)]MDM5154568.1 flavin monoamine oxidase family protein [Bacillus sp. DX1.1]WJE84052.1 flavin monoamine oxidase family protein [Bacillus sp. DX3.1]
MQEPMQSRFTIDEMLRIIDKGLPKTTHPKHILIIGAGMAGLVSASLLKNAGHHVKILEANCRVGGRIETVRMQDTGLYLDVGAMRIPYIHTLTMAYIKKFGLQVNPFINRNETDIIYANGRKTTLQQYEKDPSILRYPVTMNEEGKTSEELLLLAVQPIIDFIKRDPDKNWTIVEKEFGMYSMAAFLKHHPYQYKTYFSPAAIEMIGVLLDLEGFQERSVVEVLRFLYILQQETGFCEIVGGNDALPKAFLPQLQDDIVYNQKLMKLHQHENGVTAYLRHEETYEYSSITGDLVITTIPFSTMRFVEIDPFDSVSHGKWRAIRELHYMAATKIGIQFKSRFWEEQGQKGGRIITDLPIRYAYYPSYGIGSKGPAMMLGSYTWSYDALLWDGLSKHDRIYYTLQNLATILGGQVYDEFISGIAKNWALDPYALGGFAIFQPSQETELQPYVAKPEGKIFFAGDHTTLTHGWIQGAIESGIRAAAEVNQLRVTE